MNYKEFISSRLVSLPIDLPVVKLETYTLLTDKFYNYIHLDASTINTLIDAVKPIVQDTSIPLVKCLLYLRSKHIASVVDISKYQRLHRNPDFELRGYIQILNSLLRLDCYMRDELIEELQNLYNQADLQLKMCIADIVLLFNTNVGDIMLNEIRRLDPDYRENNMSIRISKKTYVNDTQNVHNTKINKKCLECILFLCREYDPAPLKHFEKLLKDHKHAIDQICYNVSTFSGFTLLNILESLWTFIEGHHQKDDMIISLKSALVEMDNYCGTGYASRLINCIQGFDNIPEEMLLNVDIKEDLYMKWVEYAQSVLSSNTDMMDAFTSDITKLYQFLKKDEMPKFKKKYKHCEITNDIETYLLKRYTGI
jgi:hypothetical protein